jgi:lysine-specific demethylase 3
MQVVCNANKLASLVKKKKKKQNWLDYYQLKYSRDQSQRPQMKVILKIQSDSLLLFPKPNFGFDLNSYGSWMFQTGFLGLWGGKVDAIDYHISEIEKLSEEVSSFNFLSKFPDLSKILNLLFFFFLSI